MSRPQFRLQSIFYIGSLSLFASSFSFADNHIAITEADYLDDIPIIFSATRLPQKIDEAPASVTIIDRSMIEASSALTITDLLRLVPGMQSYNTATNTFAASYHGLSDKFPPRMEVMLDGHSIYIPLFSTVLWDTLPITVDDIDHIEVIRGSNTVTQGSNAFLGAINIITHTPLSLQESTLKYTTGELNTKNIEFRHSGDTEISHYTISAGTLKNDGFFFDHDLKSNTVRDPAQRRYLNFSTTLSPSLQDSFTINLGLSEGYTTVGDIDNKPDLERRDYDTNYQHLSWNHLIDDSNELNISYSHNLNNLEAENLSIEATKDTLGVGDALAIEFLAANNPYRVTAEVGDVEQHDIEVSLKHEFSPASKLISGFGYKFDRARSREILDTNDWVSEERSRLFGNWEYSGFSNWAFNTGAMLEHASNGGTKLSPRLAANYKINEFNTLRSSVSRAYRMPSLLETNYQSVIYTPASLTPAPFDPVYEIETLANKDLKPEQIDTFDIGYFAHWPDHYSQLDLRLFYEEISNGITTSYRALDTPLATGDDKYRTEMNRAQWINRGFETQYKYQSDTPLKPLIVFNYGYIDTRGYRNYGLQAGPGTPEVMDRFEQRNPMHTASLLASITLPDNLQLSMTRYFLSQVRWLEGGGHTPNPTYHRTDIKIAKTFNLQGSHNLRLSLIVQNLQDDAYPEFYERNLFERRTYLQAKLSF